MTSVSTHILDTARGRPAEGVPVSFAVWANGGWQRLGESITGPDGRVTDLPEASIETPLTCRLVFAVEEYLVARHGAAFYPEISVAFVAEPGEHYHLPLLLTPFGYATYRGS